MRKSCVQFVQTLAAFCGQTHALYAGGCASLMHAGYFRASFARLLRTQTGLFCTVVSSHSESVPRSVSPTFHMTNNNYNFLYISI
jgi:hypothetical protein